MVSPWTSGRPIASRAMMDRINEESVIRTIQKNQLELDKGQKSRINQYKSSTKQLKENPRFSTQNNKRFNEKPTTGYNSNPSSDLNTYYNQWHPR